MIKVFNNNKTFEQIAPSLVQALIELGFEVCLTSIIDLESLDLYIIVALQTIDQLPKRFIVYNFEQLQISSYLGPNCYEKMNKAISVWDYSLINVEFLKTKGICATHVPFGYTDKLLCDTGDLKDREKNIDILFIGGISPRRKIILKNLTKKLNDNSTLFFSENCYGDKFNETVTRSKIGLNIHYYCGRPWILEVCRIIPLIANGCYVISEHSDDNWYDEQFKGKIFFADLKNLPTAINLVSSSEDTSQISNSQKWLREEFNHSSLILKSGVIEQLFNE